MWWEDRDRLAKDTQLSPAGAVGAGDQAQGHGGEETGKGR